MTLPSPTRTPEDLVIGKLIQVMQLRDPGLAEHGRRTAEIAVAMGGALGCEVDLLDRLYLAGVLHDIGKLGVTESTLWKPAGLTHAEWREVRTHPEEGHLLVADVVHRDVASAILYHHERADGNGYPFGVDAGELPLVARLIQVADAFDSMTTGRPYQPAVPVEVAVEEIERCAGTQFDEEAVAALVSVCATRGDPRLGIEPAADGVEPGPGFADEPDFFDVPMLHDPHGSDGPPAPEEDRGAGEPDSDDRAGRAPADDETAEEEEVGEVIDITGGQHGPPSPEPADPFAQPPSMIRLRRNG